MPDTEGSPAPEVRASRLLRNRAIWITPAVLASVLIFLMTLIYVGSIVDPPSHLHGLRVLVVNQDAGSTVAGKRVDIGQQVASALEGSSAVSSRLSLDAVTLSRAKTDMNKNHGYLAIVIPPRFTNSTLAIYGVGRPDATTPPIPTIQLLGNQRSGSIGVSLATGVTHPALTQISRTVGRQLSASATGRAGTTAQARAVQADPFTLAAVTYRPLPAGTALGLSAFYIALLSIMCGFIGATIVNSTVDAALGFATSEVGPKWSQRLPTRITRWQTLLAKWVIAAALVPLLTGLMLVAAITVLNMNAPSVGYLWLFTSCAAIVVTIGTLVLFAALGTIGQLVAILVFVYLALASSGGTVPLNALPGLFRFAANFEPLRQILDGVRAILYFGAAGDAGLTRGFMMTGVGLVFWMLIGFAVTTWYDRKGFYRIEPDLIAYVTHSAQTYPERGEGRRSPAPGQTGQSEAAG